MFLSAWWKVMRLKPWPFQCEMFLLSGQMRTLSCHHGSCKLVQRNWQWLSSTWNSMLLVIIFCLEFHIVGYHQESLHLAEKYNYVLPEWILHNIQSFGDTEVCGAPQFLLLFNNISCYSLFLNQGSWEKLFLGKFAPLWRVVLMLGDSTL